MRNISRVISYDLFRRGFMVISGDKEYVHNSCRFYRKI